MRVNPELRTVTDPYGDETLVAMPAIPLDAALVHMNRADMHGNAQYLGPDLYFDDLFCMAAEQVYVSCERIVPTAELPPTRIRRRSGFPPAGVRRGGRAGGAHFTSCVPDYDRDEASQQREYVTAARDPEKWQAFVDRYLAVPEAEYQRAVRGAREEASA